MKQSGVKEYFKPLSLDEAVSTLSSYEGKICVVAGATDVFADDHEDVEALLDISDLKLNYIAKGKDHIKIGSATTFNDIINNEEICSNFKCLWEAAKSIGDKTIRNRATIGGNICSSVPSADSVPALIALNSTLIIKTPKEEKEVKIEDFFTGPRQNVLKKVEIVKEIIIPISDRAQGSAFEKLSRNSVDLALSNAAVAITVDDEEKITEIKIALGAVAPTAVRAKKLESSLIGSKLDEGKLEESAQLVEEAISPISDVRSSDNYRKEASEVLAKRVIRKAYQRAVEKLKAKGV